MSKSTLVYTALIRTYRCDALLVEVVNHLNAQTMPPKEVIFVDSSGDAECGAKLEDLGGRVVRYPDGEFNYSRAINVGIETVTTPFVLVNSAHTILLASDIIERGWRAAQEQNIDVLFWSDFQTQKNDEQERRTVIDIGKFNGHNGYQNSCGMLPTKLAKDRPFREEVFASEDQEWGAWYLRSTGGSTMMIETEDFKYANPNLKGNDLDPDFNHDKKINEILAVAYYTYRRNLMPDRIAARILRSLLALLRGRKGRAGFHWAVAMGLLKANFIEPKRKSRYF